MYTKDKVLLSCLNHFNGDYFPSKIWMDKYCLKDSDETFLELNPSNTVTRLAKEIFRIEKNYKNTISYETIHNLLTFHLLPGGSLLYGIGNNNAVSSLGNCFVIGNENDSYGGIFQIDQHQVQLMKRRGGVGHDISHLRPKNSKVTNSAKFSSGAVSFMSRYSSSTHEVGQDGRRGALMLTINISHPDSMDFIVSKSDISKLNDANISVKVDDEFMRAVIADKDYELKFVPNLRNKSKREKGTVSLKVKAKVLWDKLIHQAWKNAEPGILFWDTIIRESPADCYPSFKSVSTNPCGEIPLCPYDSCRLLSVNLVSFVVNAFKSDAYFDWKKFEKTIRYAQKIMDDVVDLELEKINKILQKISEDEGNTLIKIEETYLWNAIRNKLLKGRRTGLSGIGIGDTLAALGMRYSSEEGLEYAEEIYKRLAINSYISSIYLAKERGAFPDFDINKEKDNIFINRILDAIPVFLDKEKIKEMYAIYGRRNIANLTIPPSGTISIIARISSGIEPVYDLLYKRRKKVPKNSPNIVFTDKNGDCWEEYNVLHHMFEVWIETTDTIADSTRKILLQKIKSNTIKEDDLQKLIELSPYLGSTAYELNPLDRVEMQSRIQKWVDHSISSTINLKRNTTENVIEDIYMAAWRGGLKGITVYRDGSREGVLISKEDNSRSTFEEFKALDAPKRPKELDCEIFTTTSNKVHYTLIVGLLKGNPYEVFATTDKVTSKRYSKGKTVRVSRGHYKVIGDVSIDHLMENMPEVCKVTTRLISSSLRHRKHIKFVVEELYKLPGEELYTFNKVLARILKKYIKDGEKVTGRKCENCGSEDLEYSDGCGVCKGCGDTKCS